jgi:hypothetical protein
VGISNITHQAGRKIPEEIPDQGDIISIADTGTPKSIDFRSFFLFLRSHRPPIPPLGCVLWGHFPRSLLAPSRLPPRFLLGVQERRSAKKRFTNVRPPNVAPSRIRLSFTKGASESGRVFLENPSKTMKKHQNPLKTMKTHQKSMQNCDGRCFANAKLRLYGGRSPQ